MSPGGDPPDPNQSDGPYACVNCGSPLPIEVCADREDAVSVACAFCGTRYRGVVIDAGPEADPANVLIMD